MIKNSGYNGISVICRIAPVALLFYACSPAMVQTANMKGEAKSSVFDGQSFGTASVQNTSDPTAFENKPNIQSHNDAATDFARQLQFEVASLKTVEQLAQLLPFLTQALKQKTTQRLSKAELCSTLKYLHMTASLYCGQYCRLQDVKTLYLTGMELAESYFAQEPSCAIKQCLFANQPQKACFEKIPQSQYQPLYWYAVHLEMLAQLDRFGAHDWFVQVRKTIWEFLTAKAPTLDNAGPWRFLGAYYATIPTQDIELARDAFHTAMNLAPKNLDNVLAHLVYVSMAKHSIEAVQMDYEKLSNLVKDSEQNSQYFVFSYANWLYERIYPIFTRFVPEDTEPATRQELISYIYGGRRE